MFEICDSIDSWRDSRNNAIHQTVKLNQEMEDIIWEKRYKKIKKVAVDGKSIANKLSSIVKRLNKK